MSGRSWFYASEGKQQGPFPEIQLRELIARGAITPDTLVWTEGMANWQKAAEIPGLAPGGSGPPVMPRSGGALPSVGGHGDGPLSIDLVSRMVTLQGNRVQLTRKEYTLLHALAVHADWSLPTSS